MAQIKAFPCPGGPACNCGNTIVRGSDDDGRPIIAALLPRAATQTFLAELAAAAEGRAPEPAERLNAIRCEGTA